MNRQFPRAATLGALVFFATVGVDATVASAQTATPPAVRYVYPRGYTAPRAYSSYYYPPQTNSVRPRRGLFRRLGNRRKDWPTGRGVPLAKPWLNPR